MSGMPSGSLVNRTYRVWSFSFSVSLSLSLIRSFDWFEKKIYKSLYAWCFRCYHSITLAGFLTQTISSLFCYRYHVKAQIDSEREREKERTVFFCCCHWDHPTNIFHQRPSLLVRLTEARNLSLSTSKWKCKEKRERIQAACEREQLSKIKPL